MYTSAKYSRARERISAKSKAMAIAMKRKEEYLGARVPKELKERVIECASALGIPVSILIRNTLEEAFGAKGSKVGAARATKDVTNRQSDAGTNRFPTVLGWEDIRLNRLAVCSCCKKDIEPGSHATLGIAADGEERIILCDICKESI